MTEMTIPTKQLSYYLFYDTYMYAVVFTVLVRVT